MTEAGDPKIIVDSEWKSRVEAEKEEAKRKERGEPRPQRASSPELPPASFPVLISTLATQALVALGQLPDPLSGQPDPNPPIAQHFIDTLAMLEEKTKGNLDAEERAMLSEVLHQLRMAFVTLCGQPGESPDSSPAGTIQMP